MPARCSTAFKLGSPTPFVKGLFVDAVAHPLQEPARDILKCAQAKLALPDGVFLQVAAKHARGCYEFVSGEACGQEAVLAQAERVVEADRLSRLGEADRGPQPAVGRDVTGERRCRSHLRGGATVDAFRRDRQGKGP